MTAHLKELARQVRGGTLTLLRDANESALLWTPPGLSNHVLWHAGHALWLQDVLCVVPLTGHSRIPPDWGESFGMHCRPVDQTSDWPDREALAELLSQQLVQVQQLMDDHAEQLAHIDPRHERDFAGRVVHAWHDEARHQGEMWLLLKQHRAATAK